jgi:NAD(P)-dependent dehydrogenase (short-subunit alcohol dehydrogenase family)
VTGSNSGIGKELAKILYSKDAKVYMMTRSQERALKAITEIKEQIRSSKGELIFVALDLSDLNQVRLAAHEILSRETRLHTLFNNAGIGVGTSESHITVQGHDRWLGVNCVGPHLLTKLLTPCLIETAKTDPAGSTRVVWVSSASAELPDVPTGGVPMEHIADLSTYQAKYSVVTRYGISRAGNILQAAEFAKLYEKERIISYAMHPGVVDTESFTPLAKTNNIAYIFKILFMQPAIYGAHTELYAGLSPDLASTNQQGKWGKHLSIGDVNLATNVCSGALRSDHE